MPRDGSRLTYTLNVIDTPGLGNTREFERNQRIIDQIRQLFLKTEAEGVLFLDAVCFVVKAADVRLTVALKDMFCSILSLFGKDIESNICTLITFADGAEPPVLGSLKEADIPFGSTFQFNNSALFVENINLTSTSLSNVIWDMDFKSFKQFFEEINHFKTRSLSLTRDVLQERGQLKNIIDEIFPQIKGGLIKLSELRDELDLLKQNKNDMKNSEDFEYNDEEVLYSGNYVTNCLNCKTTCHYDCDIGNYDAIRNCCVMKDGNCTVCPNKCNWTFHRNQNYTAPYSVKKVKKTSEKMKMKYEEANKRKLFHESLLQNKLLDLENIFVSVENMMTKMNCCTSRLKEIELRPDPLYTLDHSDLMIQAENYEKQPGYQSRISEVNQDYETFYAKFNSLQQEINMCGISSNTKKE